LYGKPLLQYSVEAAQKVFNNSQIALSTDSLEMQELGLSLGLNVPSLRPRICWQQKSDEGRIIT
tara:strand:+ start:1062 stop:1253 length:192 start_codon:yes stop_codon:yes gene_type:complete